MAESLPQGKVEFRSEAAPVHQPEIAWGFRHRGLIGAIILVPAGLLTLCTQPLIPQGTWLSLLFDFLGWAAFYSGAAMRLWATCYVGCRKRSSLITTGPYSICRNPLYVASFLIALSCGFFLKSLVFTGAIALVALAYVYATVPSEERVLHSLHGSAYEDYCARTPRFWPRFSAFQTAEVVEVKTRAFRMEGKRMLVWIWLPFLAQAVGFLRNSPWWPLLFHLP